MNRVALIIGVGPGLGVALGRRLARAGFRVALVARSREFIDKLARELHSLGQPSLALAADASQPADIVDREKMTLDVSGHYSRADVFSFQLTQGRRAKLRPGIKPDPKRLSK